MISLDLGPIYLPDGTVAKCRVCGENASHQVNLDVTVSASCVINEVKSRFEWRCNRHRLAMFFPYIGRT